MNTSGCFGWQGFDIISRHYSKCSPAEAGSDHEPWSLVPRCGRCTCVHTFPVRQKLVTSLFWGSIISLILNSVSKYILLKCTFIILLMWCLFITKCYFLSKEKETVQYLTLQLLSVNNYCQFVVSLKNNRFSVCGFRWKIAIVMFVGLFLPQGSLWVQCMEPIESNTSCLWCLFFLTSHLSTAVLIFFSLVLILAWRWVGQIQLSVKCVWIQQNTVLT